MAASTTSHALWRKSSYSAGDLNCVEVAMGPHVVGLRDSKNPEAGHIAVKAATFRSFVNHLKGS